MINKTKRKRDELDLELKKLGNKKLKEASKKLEREHVILEGSLIRMATDTQSHNKKTEDRKWWTETPNRWIKESYET